MVQVYITSLLCHDDPVTTTNSPPEKVNCGAGWHNSLEAAVMCGEHVQAPTPVGPLGGGGGFIPKWTGITSPKLEGSRTGNVNSVSRMIVFDLARAMQTEWQCRGQSEPLV